MSTEYIEAYMAESTREKLLRRYADGERPADVALATMLNADLTGVITEAVKLETSIV